MSMFQLYLEHLTYFVNVSSVNWNVVSVIWNVSSVNTTVFMFQKENLNVFGVACS